MSSCQVHDTHPIPLLASALSFADGDNSEAITLPSVGAAEPTKSGLHADIANTYGVLRTLAEQGRQVIVVSHW